jgi:hypothetical protein
MASAAIRALAPQPVPSDIFSLNDITFVEIDYRGTAAYAKLSLTDSNAHDVHDRLRAGEQERGQCSIISKRQNRSGKRKQLLDEWTWFCTYGKHDKTERRKTAECGSAVHNTDAEDSVSSRKRRGKATLGDSIKRGCGYSVSLKRADDEPDVLVIRAGQRDHIDASGIAVHKDVGPSRISEDTRSWVLEQLSASLPTSSIVEGALIALVSIYITLIFLSYSTLSTSMTSRHPFPFDPATRTHASASTLLLFR